MSHNPWTEQKMAALRKLWAEGHSTADIGRQIGFTKNAVVGKAHRLSLPERPSPIKQRNPHAPAKLHVMRAPPTTLPPLGSLADAPIELLPALAVSAAIVVPMIARASSPCCWPIGEPGRPGFHFCEAPSQFGKSYCQAHQEKGTIRLSQAAPSIAATHRPAAMR